METVTAYVSRCHQYLLSLAQSRAKYVHVNCRCLLHTTFNCGSNISYIDEQIFLKVSGIVYTLLN